MEPGISMSHSQSLSDNPYPELNQLIPCTDIYFFKIHSNITLPSTPRLPKGLLPTGVLFNILKALLPSSILAT